VDRRLNSSGSPWEPTFGYSHAVRIGDRVFVSGTAPIMPAGGVQRAHGELFGEIRPATTAVIVKALLDLRWRWRSKPTR
jgi:enamine deaminase RidA (YjgF/YER057c/UK114 family)